MRILDKIKKLCIDKGISVGDLEKELELSNGSIYKWNKTIPGADKVEKVADYFNVSVDYLLGRTEIKEKNDFSDKGLNLSDHTISFLKELDGILEKNKPTNAESVVALDHVLNNAPIDYDKIPAEHHENIKLMIELYKKVQFLDRDEIKRVNQYIQKIEVEKTSDYLLPDAAHEIEGASDEDKAHDDALMDDDDF